MPDRLHFARDPELTKPVKRRPMLILDVKAAFLLMRTYKYTGPIIGHMAEGKLLKVEVANPAGWTT